MKQAAQSATRHTMLLAAALASLITLVDIPPADAFFGFNPCRSCRGYLIFCCPRPCPVRDSLQRSQLSRIRVAADQRRDLLDHSTQASHRLSETLGSPGPQYDLLLSAPPVDRLSPGTGPLADNEPIGPSIPSATSPDGLSPFLEPNPRFTSQQLLAHVNDTTIADSAEALETLSWSLAAAEEMVAATSDTMPASQDIRAMLRRAIEMSIAIQKITANLSALRAFRAKLESQPALQQPALLPSD